MSEGLAEFESNPSGNPKQVPKHCGIGVVSSLDRGQGI